MFDSPLPIVGIASDGGMIRGYRPLKRCREKKRLKRAQSKMRQNRNWLKGSHCRWWWAMGGEG